MVWNMKHCLTRRLVGLVEEKWAQMVADKLNNHKYMYKLYSSLDHRSAHLQKPLHYPIDPIDLSAGFGVLLIFYAEQGTLRRTS